MDGFSVIIPIIYLVWGVQQVRGKEDCISRRQLAKDKWATILGPSNAFEVGSSLNGVAYER